MTATCDSLPISGKSHGLERLLSGPAVTSKLPPRPFLVNLSTLSDTQYAMAFVGR
jgi:hypothetical protein